MAFTWKREYLVGLFLVIFFGVFILFRPDPNAAKKTYVGNNDNNNNNNYFDNTPDGSEEDWFDLEPKKQHTKVPGVHSDKWVVVTTINYPTDAIKKLAALPGWRVVVVADKKTPKDWKWENCDFLSVEKQKELGYYMHDLLPWNHYGRKNLGYIYAIQHGAKTVYETDDDNLLNQDHIVYLEEYADVKSIGPNDPSISVVNPYAHFGEPTIWPRGYPLEHIMKSQTYHLGESKRTLIPIQQGLANKDPDVDAIFRLTRKLDITFANNEPVSLASGAMTPFNSQNTVFHNRALWGMLIPITTTFRVCDIWRGYWSQRLVWEIGGTLAFLPASVIQNRNPHHLLEDFIDEDDLYKQAGKLVKFLKEWKSDRTDFFERLVQLSLDMAEAGFWDIGDAQLAKAWVKDLKAAGYRAPQIQA